MAIGKLRKERGAAACRGMLQNSHQQAPKSGAAACCGMLQLWVFDMIPKWACRLTSLKSDSRISTGSTMHASSMPRHTKNCVGIFLGKNIGKISIPSLSNHSSEMASTLMVKQCIYN